MLLLPLTRSDAVSAVPSGQNQELLVDLVPQGVPYSDR